MCLVFFRKSILWCAALNIFLRGGQGWVDTRDLTFFRLRHASFQSQVMSQNNKTYFLLWCEVIPWGIQAVEVLNPPQVNIHCNYQHFPSIWSPGKSFFLIFTGTREAFLWRFQSNVAVISFLSVKTLWHIKGSFSFLLRGRAICWVLGAHFVNGDSKKSVPTAVLFFLILGHSFPKLMLFHLAYFLLLSSLWTFQGD